MHRELTAEEREFVDTLTAKLPPVISRHEAPKFLGGLVAAKTLANADAAGNGPAVAYRVGRAVAYRTDALAMWLVVRLGVQRIGASLDQLL
ncbi:hypothetical protein JCM14635_25850 [Megalodesulfovibrio paquesii]